MEKDLKKMNNKIKCYENQMKNIDNYIVDEYINKDNKIQININLYDGLEIFNPMSMGKQKELNKEIYDYIDDKTIIAPFKYDICICFFNSKLTKKEENKIKSIIQEHYYLTLQENKIALKLNSIKIISLIIIGFIFLSLYFILELKSNNPLFLEFLSIAGSFSIWEAVDFYLLERKGLKLKRLNAGQSVLSDVKFIRKNSIEY